MGWFTRKTTINESTLRPRILVFNCSHERNPVELLQLLVPAGFSRVYFAKADSSRPSPLTVPSAVELLGDQGIKVQTELLVKQTEGAKSSWQETLASIWNHLDPTGKAVSVNMSASDVIVDLSTKVEGEVEVLVTGSLYLVGSFLRSIEWSEASSPPVSGRS